MLRRQRPLLVPSRIPLAPRVGAGARCFEPRSLVAALAAAVAIAVGAPVEAKPATKPPVDAASDSARDAQGSGKSGAARQGGARKAPASKPASKKKNEASVEASKGARAQPKTAGRSSAAKPGQPKRTAARPAPKRKAAAAKPETDAKAPPAASAGASAPGETDAANGARPRSAQAARLDAGSKRARASAGESAGSSDRALGPSCLGRSVRIDRGAGPVEEIPLVDCRGAPIESARVHLSVLARPHGAAEPDRAAIEAAIAAVTPPKPGSKRGASASKAARDAAKNDPPKNVAQAPTGEIAPGVHLLDRGLALRLDRIARKYPDRTISIVSGYRPGARGSLHQTGRAIDVRVAGVPNEELVAFCKTLPDTGCGYYPNSSFVHVDVRLPGTGTVSWIDASRPGEEPRYVTSWPPRGEGASLAESPPPPLPPAKDATSEDHAARAPSAGREGGSDDEDPYTSGAPQDGASSAKIRLLGD